MTTLSEPRALVVDDNPSWQEILAEILTSSGLVVDLASDLAQAVQKLRSQPHKIAVVDLSLQDSDHHNLDGLQVLDAVRQYDPGCTALLLTGYATVDIAVEAMNEHGALTCLRKDAFRRGKFLQFVDKALASVPVPFKQTHAHDKRLNVKSAPRTPPNPKSMSSPIPVLGKVLLVEDDAGWQDFLYGLLVEAGYAVQPCNSLVEALGQLNRDTFQLAVVDLSLSSSLAPVSNRDGYRLLAAAHEAHLPTIVVSGFADPERISQAYTNYGIFACLEKQKFNRQTFLATLQDVRQTTQQHALLDSLTRREVEVLHLLAQGLTNKEMAETLFVTHNTIKRHLKSIFKKLDVHTRASATAVAISMGFSSENR